MPIIDKTKEYYPDLPDAEYLLFDDPSVPEGVIISKSNVLMGLKSKKLVAKKNMGYWGWAFGDSFCQNFNSPEEAIADYKKLANYTQKKKSF